MVVCLSVCLSACLFICMLVCLSVCLSVCLYVCLPACLPVYLSVCMLVFLSVCLSVCLYLCMLGRLSVPRFLCFCRCVLVMVAISGRLKDFFFSFSIFSLWVASERRPRTAKQGHHCSFRVRVLHSLVTRPRKTAERCSRLDDLRPACLPMTRAWLFLYAECYPQKNRRTK